MIGRRRSGERLVSRLLAHGRWHSGGGDAIGWERQAQAARATGAAVMATVAMLRRLREPVALSATP